MKPAEVCEVRQGSLAEENGIQVGDKLVSVNGRPLRDILDYEIGSADFVIDIELIREGYRRVITIENPHHEGLGICFHTSLFDGMKKCGNRCIFCFIDQLPPGMRQSVYVKDDDYRLSFLYGNFITLTNVRNEDIQRIVDDRLSPMYVSIHTTNPDLRALMLGNKKAARSLHFLSELSDAGIELHVQIVVCPGINDGRELERSIEDLSRYSNVASVGLVPVGLTGYREGLYPLRAFEKKEMVKLIEQVKGWQEVFEGEKGSAWVYVADEFYIATGCDLPSIDHYGEFPQIENGIGLSRLFINEAMANLDIFKETPKKRIAVVTGKLFSSVMERIVGTVRETTGMDIEVIPAENAYFGGKVSVTGLLAGSDIVDSVEQWLTENDRPDILVVPDIVLNGNGLMLDDYLPEMVSEELDIEVKIVESSGPGFITGLMEV